MVLATPFCSPLYAARPAPRQLLHSLPWCWPIRSSNSVVPHDSGLIGAGFIGGIMGTVVTSTHIQPDHPPGQTAVATWGSMGDGAFQKITKWLPGERLRDLDLSTLTRLLRKAEQVATSTSLLLRIPAGTGTPVASSCVRTARRWKRRPMSVTSRQREHIDHRD